jgi:transposase
MPKPSKSELIVSEPESSLQQPQRRVFTVEEKIRIVREAERCAGPGAVAELLRREGLYSSHLSKWRALLREHGEQGLAERKPGRPSTRDERDTKLEALARENARLRAELDTANQVIDFQKNYLGLRPTSWTRSSVALPPAPGSEGAAGCFLVACSP